MSTFLEETIATSILDSIKISSDEKQLDKDQDFTRFFSGIDIETGEKWKGGFVADGHAHKYDSFMNIVKMIDYLPLLSHTDPIPFIRNKINELTIHCNINSGMTFVLIKVYENRLITYSIGDSSVYVFINDNLVYKNILHSFDNQSELKRLQNKIIKKKSIKPLILSENKVIMENSCYFLFTKANFSLATTQSFGHCDQTDIVPEVFEITFTNTDKIRIVAGSDGFFDMHSDFIESDMHDLKNKSLKELIEKAEYRWKKDWEYCSDKKNLSKFSITKFPSYDDISLLLIEN
jgi:hypothetical protein